MVIGLTEVQFVCQIGRPGSRQTELADRIGRHEVLLSINHNHYNFREQINIKKNEKKFKRITWREAFYQSKASIQFHHCLWHSKTETVRLHCSIATNCPNTLSNFNLASKRNVWMQRTPQRVSKMHCRFGFAWRRLILLADTEVYEPIAFEQM